MALSLFVDPKDSVIVNFVVGISQEHPDQIYCDVDEKTLLDIYPEIDKTTVEQHSAVFRIPTFEDHSKMINDTFKVTADGISSNPAAMQLGRFVRLLKSWTLSEKPTAESIKNLQPMVALVINGELERLLSSRGL